MDNSDRWVYGGFLGFAAGWILCLGFLIPATQHEVEKEWCLSKSDTLWLENTCWEIGTGKKVKLK